jgi:hypothetical protein
MSRREECGARPAPVRGILLITALLFLVPAAGAARADVARSSAQAGRLGREVDGMVAELLSRDAAKAKLKAAGRRVVFEGVAWDAGSGAAAGTSAFGLELSDAVNTALTRRRIGVPAPDSMLTRGIGGAIVRGAFSSLGSAVGVVLSLVDINTGRIVSEVKRRLDPSSLAEIGMSELLPPGAENAKLLARLVQGVIGTGPQPFPIQVRTARGPHAAYFEGERLQVFVQADRDCYLRLYHISWTEKTLTLIFPNRSEPDSRIAGGARVQVPAEGSAATFEVSKPYGVDAIVAVASEQPFPDALQAPGSSAAEGAPAAPGDAVQDASGPADPAPPSDAAAEGEFVSEQDVDEERTTRVLMRGLMVRHRPAAPAASDAGSLADPGGGRGPLARAVCYFTTLPRISVSRP